MIRDLAGDLPTIVVALVAMIAAAASAGLAPFRLPSSPWRVPRSWSRLGGGWYASAFGFVLGFALVTAIPSTGLYVLLAWALSVEWVVAWLAFAAFAFARMTPLLISLVLGPERVNAAMAAWIAKATALRARPAESVLLALGALIILL
jgi:hypothetical protein